MITEETLAGQKLLLNSRDNVDEVEEEKVCSTTTFTKTNGWEVGKGHLEDHEAEVVREFLQSKHFYKDKWVFRLGKRTYGT